MGKRSLEQKNKLGCGIFSILIGLMFSVGSTIGVFAEYEFHWWDILAPFVGILPIAYGIALIRSRPHSKVIDTETWGTIDSSGGKWWRPTWTKTKFRK